MDIKLTIGVTPELKELAENLIGILGKSNVATGSQITRATVKASIQEEAQQEVEKEPIAELPKVVTVVEKTPEAPTKITVEALRSLVQQKATGGKKEEVKKLLTAHGAASVTALGAEKYQEFYNQVNAL